MEDRKDLLVELNKRLSSILELLDESTHKPDPEDKIFWLVTEALDVVEEELDMLD